MGKKQELGLIQRKIIFSLLKRLIKQDFGAKCVDYDATCTICIMYHAYETLYEEMKDDPK